MPEPDRTDRAERETPVPAVVPSPDTARRLTITRGDIDLAVYEQGQVDGPCVVLVHGWPDTHRLWDGVVPLLAQSHRVITYDTRGHGESSVPPTTSGFALDEYADDLYAVIQAVSPDRPVHLVGHDWGSVQCWEAVCRPDADEWVASFTSISGPSLDHLAVWVRRRLAEPSARGIGQVLGQLASSAYTALFMTPVLPGLLLRALGRPRTWKAFLRIIDGTPAERIHLADSLQADMISGLRIYTANIVPRLMRPVPRATPVPVQLLVNHRDIAVRPAVYSDTEQWVTALSRIDLPTGHWLPFRAPHLIADAVAELDPHVRTQT